MLNIRNQPVVWQTRDGNINETIYTDATNILVVDDINDSGITFSDVVDNIVENNDVDQTKIKTVSLWTRYSSNFRVDHTVNTIDNDDWIVFPWEQEN